VPYHVLFFALLISRNGLISAKKISHTKNETWGCDLGKGWIGNDGMDTCHWRRFLPKPHAATTPWKMSSSNTSIDTLLGSRTSTCYVARSTLASLAGLLFSRVRKIAKSCYQFRHVTSVCPSVCPHGTTRLPLGGSSWNFTQDLTKILRKFKFN
jgi:hypothetical protein